jgi:hypothetical protein
MSDRLFRFLLDDSFDIKKVNHHGFDLLFWQLVFFGHTDTEHFHSRLWIGIILQDQSLIANHCLIPKAQIL